MTISYEPLDPPAETDAHYFELEEFRLEQGLDETQASDEDVIRNRALAEAAIEQPTQVAFIPRRAVERVAVTGIKTLLGRPLVRELEAVVDVYEFSWPPEQIAAQLRTLDSWVFGLPTPGATVTYTHGYDRPPDRIRRAAMIATRVWTLRGPVDERATQLAVEGATVNLATPGVLGSLTGIPEVDAAIIAHSHSIAVG